MADTKISLLNGLAQTDIVAGTDLLAIVDVSGTETKKATPLDVVGAAAEDATAKTTPVDADSIPLTDSAASNVLKKVTWANVKATLATWLGFTAASAATSTTFDFYEDTDNGVHKTSLKGATSIASDRTITMPDATGTMALTADLAAYQPLDAQLTDVAGLTPTDNGVIIGNGANFVVESGATLKTSLGLTIGTDVQAYDADLTDIALRWVAASASGPASLDFHEDTDNGAHKVTVKAPASLSGDRTVTLPSVDGTLIVDSGGSFLGAINEIAGVDIASAGTINIGGAAGNYVHITGTTTITGGDSIQAGTERILVFDGILTFTHNATSWILPTGANITTAAGDVAVMRSEGSGNWRCILYQRKSGAALTGGGALTNWTEAYSNSAPNNTVTVVSFVPNTGDTNTDAVLNSKGTGALQRHIADSASTGGNKRGTYAVDWQGNRGLAAEVASGAYAGIPSGYRNKAAADYGIVAGYFNYDVAGGGYNAVFGSNNTANGVLNAAIFGDTNAANSSWTFLVGRSNTIISFGAPDSQAMGRNCEVEGAPYGLAHGYYARSYLHGMKAHASGRRSATGDRQASELILSRAITGTSATELFLDGSALRAVIPDGKTWNVEISVSARVTTVGNGTVNAADSHGSNYGCTINRVGSTTALVGGVDQFGTDRNSTNMAGCDVTITADDTNEALAITFTPATLAGSTTVTSVTAVFKITETA